MRRGTAERIAAGLLAVSSADRAMCQAAASAAASAEQAGAATGDPIRAEGALTVLGVSLNRRQLDDDTLLAIKDGAALVPLDDLTTWRLRAPGAKQVTIDGQAFVPLAAVPGLTFVIDAERQRLLLTVPIDAFEATSLGARTTLPRATDAARTAFLDYDITVEHSTGRPITAGFVEMGVSDERGLLTNTMTIGNALAGQGVVRLDTYFVRDDADGLRRLTIGDGLTHGSSWTPEARFGGIHYGTDFALQPNFLPFPTPTFGGRASVPSSVEIYINNVLNYQSPVREGPFTLDRLPVVSGQGDATLVVRDALGVERRVVSSYYVSTELLRPGLSDYSLEAGAERDDYGVQSFHYGSLFAAATYRRGITRDLTLETRTEIGRHLQGTGAGFTAVLGHFGEAGAAVAVSTGRDGTGTLYRLSAASVRAHWSFAVTYQSATRNYAQVGLADTVERPIRQLQATGGLTLKRLGSVTAGITYLRRADDNHVRVTSLHFNRPLTGSIYVDAFALRSDGSGPTGHGETTAGVSLSFSLSGRKSAFAQVDTRSRQAQIQRVVPEDHGWGYRLLGSQGTIDQQEADLSYRGHAFDATGEVARYNGQLVERVLASGGFVLAEGSILPTRRLDGGYAIVDVAGQRGVTVLQENRPVTATNGRGIAVVGQLRPYQNNRISVALNDLSLDTTIAKDTLTVVPRYLSGVRASFQVKGGHAGSLVVVLPDGKPIEPGTTIRRDGVGEPIFSGFDGEVFLDDMVEGKELVVERQAGVCRVKVPAVPKGELLPRIGPVICRAEQAK